MKMKRNTLLSKRKGPELVFLLFAFPGFLYLIINNFIPIVIGFIIAFKTVNFSVGILSSPWCGFENFRYLFQTSDAWIITRNTICYNLVFILLSTLIALGVALLMNEVHNKWFFRFFHGSILLPHLISMSIVSYLVFAFLSAQTGYVNNTILKFLEIDPISWYGKPEYWPYILVYISCWKRFGYLSLIFYASIANIDPDIYDAAEVDGASKWTQAFRITVPMIRSTVAVMVLLNIGRIFSSEFGLFYHVTMDSGSLYPVTNVIDTYVYRALLKTGDIGMASAACLYQSVVGCIIFCLANLGVKTISPDDSLF